MRSNQLSYPAITVFFSNAGAKVMQIIRPCKKTDAFFRQKAYFDKKRGKL